MLLNFNVFMNILLLIFLLKFNNIKFIDIANFLKYFVKTHHNNKKSHCICSSIKKYCGNLPCCIVNEAIKDNNLDFTPKVFSK